MFGWIKSPTRKPPRPAPSRRALSLELLEGRDCPAAPTLTFSASVVGYNCVSLSGVVTADGNISGARVTFTGVATGTTAPNSQGQYELSTQASALGTIAAEAVDAAGVCSADVSATISSNAPALGLTRSYGPGGSVLLSGHVTDEDAAGHVVTFSGAATGTAATDSNGNFSYSTTRWSLGDVSASTTDVWGLVSNTATVTLANSAPVISGFVPAQGYGNVWTFRGQVSDEYAPGLTVTLRCATIQALQKGVQVTVGGDGTFTVTVSLQPGESGTVTADVSDWLGVAAQTATTTVN